MSFKQFLLKRSLLQSKNEALHNGDYEMAEYFDKKIERLQDEIDRKRAETDT